MAHIFPEGSSTDSSPLPELMKDVLLVPLYAADDLPERTVGILSWKPGPEYKGLEIDIQYLAHLMRRLRIEYGVELPLAVLL